MKFKLLIVALVMPLYSVAGTGTHGGDPTEQDFVASAKVGINLLKTRKAEFPNVDIFLLESKIKLASVSATDNPVKDSDGHIKTVVNTASTNQITINRLRWGKIRDSDRKNAIGLHEYLGLIKLDYHYEISSQLTNLSPAFIENGRMGLLKEKGFYCWEHFRGDEYPILDCSLNAVYVNGVDFDNLKIYFNFGAFRCESDDAQDCTREGSSLKVNVLPDGRISTVNSYESDVYRFNHIVE